MDEWNFESAKKMAHKFETPLHRSFQNTCSEVEKLKAENAKLREALEYINEFSSNHHDEQAENYWLHALTIDIPDVCQKALKETSDLEGE